MEENTIESSKIHKNSDIFTNITARNAFKVVSDVIRHMVHGKQGQELKNPAGKQVVYEDGSSYFLGIDAEGTFTLSYINETSKTISELYYHLYRNGSQLVKHVFCGKAGSVRFALDGSKQYEKFE